MRADRLEFEVAVSFFEIYKDMVVDLLSERRRRVTMTREDADGPVRLGLEKQVCETESDAYQVLFQGDSNRHLEHFPWNPETSRGHVFYVIHLAHLPTDQEATVSFIDLAAVISTKNRATLSIEHSLTSLKAVISAINQNDSPPFDESILTQLLQPLLQPLPELETPHMSLITPIRYDGTTSNESLEWLEFATQFRNALRRLRGEPVHNEPFAKSVPQQPNKPMHHMRPERAEIGSTTSQQTTNTGQSPSDQEDYARGAAGRRGSLNTPQSSPPALRSLGGSLSEQNLATFNTPRTAGQVLRASIGHDQAAGRQKSIPALKLNQLGNQGGSLNLPQRLSNQTQPRGKSESPAMQSLNSTSYSTVVPDVELDSLLPRSKPVPTSSSLASSDAAVQSTRLLGTQYCVPPGGDMSNGTAEQPEAEPVVTDAKSSPPTWKSGAPSSRNSSTQQLHSGRSMADASGQSSPPGAAPSQPPRSPWDGVVTQLPRRIPRSPQPASSQTGKLPAEKVPQQALAGGGLPAWSLVRRTRSASRSSSPQPPPRSSPWSPQPLRRSLSPSQRVNEQRTHSRQASEQSVPQWPTGTASNSARSNAYASSNGDRMLSSTGGASAGSAASSVAANSRLSFEATVGGKMFSSSKPFDTTPTAKHICWPPDRSISPQPEPRLLQPPSSPMPGAVALPASACNLSFGAPPVSHSTVHSRDSSLDGTARLGSPGPPRPFGGNTPGGQTFSRGKTPDMVPRPGPPRSPSPDRRLPKPPSSPQPGLRTPVWTNRPLPAPPGPPRSMSPQTRQQGPCVPGVAFPNGAAHVDAPKAMLVPARYPSPLPNGRATMNCLTPQGYSFRALQANAGLSFAFPDASRPMALRHTIHSGRVK